MRFEARNSKADVTDEGLIRAQLRREKPKAVQLKMFLDAVGQRVGSVGIAVNAHALPVQLSAPVESPGSAWLRTPMTSCELKVPLRSPPAVNPLPGVERAHAEPVHWR